MKYFLTLKIIIQQYASKLNEVLHYVTKICSLGVAFLNTYMPKTNRIAKKYPHYEVNFLR